MRVAEVGNVGGQHGVGGVFGERLAVVGAVGHALRLRLSGRGVVSQDSAGAEARRVVLIDHSAAAEDGAEGVGLNGLTLKRPVHQVGAGGVAPRHVLPRRSEGVVLVIEIPHAVLVEQSVGIVHPAISRRVVIDGAETLAVGHIERIGCPHELPAGHVARGHLTGRRAGPTAVDIDIEKHRCLLSILERQRNIIFNFVGGQTDIEFLDHLVIAYHTDMRYILAFLNGQKQELLVG